MKKLIYLLSIAMMILGSCTEENIDPSTTNYTVSIVRECLAANELTPVTDKALVTLNIRGTEYKQHTDSLLNAHFNDILSGTATVTVTYKGYAPTKFVVDIIEKESQTSTVSMLPSSGEYAAQLFGVISAAGISIPDNINVIITPQDTVSHLVRHSGNGSLKSVYVDGLTRTVVQVQDSKFEATLPATSAGIDYTIVADDFTDAESGELFTCKPQQVTLFSGKKSAVQIKYAQPE